MAKTLTNDQYEALSRLQKWYRKYNHQFIDIAGVIGTGSWDLIQKFIDLEELDMREVMYLSHDQKQVLELAFKRYHAYYINGIIYNYTRLVDFDTLPVINPNSDRVECEWKKSVRKKVDPRYKLIVVFDSILMTKNMIEDLSSFGLPVILLRDPMLLPAPDTYTFTREPNIVLREPHVDYLKNPIIYFAHKVLTGGKISPGNYDNVSVIPRKQMNLYNLKSSDMTITVSGEIRDQINMIYREKILRQRGITNIPGEKVIVMENMYGHRLTNHEEKNIKVYLTKGVVGYLDKINRHLPGTKYVPVDFRPEFYHEAFTDLSIDRHYLNDIDLKSRQVIPDDILKAEYAYALTVPMARLSHWDKVTLVVDPNEMADIGVQKRMLYSAISRARKSLTILI
ncbi:MAG: hypothetical protein NC548_12895 [Lachnospiraceae bacterium]|nr:hypothetical protein [Lachnospiraceae bacterium]MCM1230712.1 hypothetical protein [Ruminococcus flavefaciens]